MSDTEQMTEPWTSEHIDKWLVDAGDRLNTKDGKEIRVLEFRHQPDVAVLSAWAKHFRNHYCLDVNINRRRGNLTKSDYLLEMKFPSSESPPGPSIRAGDFGEILVADYVNFRLGYRVPRIFRWSIKSTPNESLKGCDVIGFQIKNKDGSASIEDALIVFESKAEFSRVSNNTLQGAINGSAKDYLRLGVSLNYMRERSDENGDEELVSLIDRFQNIEDTPYKEKYGAASVISDEYFDECKLGSSDCTNHPHRDNFILLVIKGNELMTLVHELYERAANEA